MNRNEIESAIARALGDLLADGLTPLGSSSTTTVIAANLIQRTDTDRLRGREVFFTAGPSLYEARRAVASSSYNASLYHGRLHVVPALDGSPGAAADRFNLYDRFNHDQYVGAIDEAVRRVQQVYLLDKIATLAIVATQWEYAVPSGLDYVHGLAFVPSGSTDYADDTAFPIERNAWDIRNNAVGTPMIKFDPRFINLDDYDADSVNVWGQRKPASFAVGTSSSEVPEHFIVMQAAALLSLQRLNEGEEWLERHRYFNREADKLERQLYRYRRPGSVKVGV